MEHTLKDIRVDFYIGEELVGYKNYRGYTYQDIVSKILLDKALSEHEHRPSSAMMMMDGKEVDYDAPINESEVKYGILTVNIEPIFCVRTTPGKMLRTFYGPGYRWRDIYNHLVANGSPAGSKLILAGKVLNLDSDASDVMQYEAVLLVTPKREEDRIVSKEDVVEKKKTITVHVFGSPSHQLTITPKTSVRDLVPLLPADLRDKYRVFVGKPHSYTLYDAGLNSDAWQYAREDDVVFYVTLPFGDMFTMAEKLSG